MAILSLHLTTKEFLLGKKTCTRRDWCDRTTNSWQRAWDRGNLLHQAWDKSPRAGGRKIGTVKLTCRPYRERLADMPITDLLEEGGMCATRKEFFELISKNYNDFVTVIRFVKAE